MSNPITYEEFVSSNKKRAEKDPKKHFHYDLQIYDDDFRFTLAVPPGVIIEDDFLGLYRRRPLYDQLEEGEIFNWLCVVHRTIMVDPNQAKAS